MTAAIPTTGSRRAVLILGQYCNGTVTSAGNRTVGLRLDTGEELLVPWHEVKAERPWGDAA